MKPTRLILTPERAADPAPYLVIDRTGAVLERGALTLETARPRPEVVDVAVVPGSDVLVRWAAPASGNAQQQATGALWGLRDELAAPPERLSAALGPLQPEGRLVAVTGLALLQAWRDYFDALHVRPRAVVPNSLALAAPEDEGEVATAEVAGGLALRARGLACVVQPELAEVFVAGRTARPVEDRALETAMIALALRPPLDLTGRVGRGDPGSLRDWRLAAGLAAALALSPLAVEAASALAFRSQAAQARSETRALAVRAWPELEAASAGEIGRALKAAAVSGRATAAAAALFGAVEAVPGAELDAFGLEPGQGLNAVVTYPAFQDLDLMRAALADAGFLAEDVSTVEDAGRVVSDLRLEPRA